MTVCNSENRPCVVDSLSVDMLRSKVTTNGGKTEYLEEYLERYSERNYVYLMI